ncbi:transcription factor S [Candidatus Woesearchaeota archaeon]|nr:MAG: transcription factor S [Candidatus Woesearchaeota archaeon]
MFCPKCGSLLRPKKEKDKAVLACSCGFVDRKHEGAPLKEVVKNEEKNLNVVDGEEEGMLPLTDAECPKCHHAKAFFWLVQTRAGDEGETKFLKCESCGNTWRDYG